MSVQELLEKHKLLQCIQCGMCTGSCPVSRKTGLNIRKYMREVAAERKFTMHSKDEVWSCTTCATCEIRCPKEINPYEFLIDVRSIAVEGGEIAPTLRDTLESIFKNGNSWGMIRNKRTDWAEGLNIKHVSQGVELLYYVGCTPAYDSRVQEVARAMVKCLRRAKVDFGTFGNEENCCGSEVYSMGERGLFDFLVEENMDLFKKYSIQQGFTTCPHAYHVFNNRYSKLSVTFQHHTQLLNDLVDKGGLKLKKKLNKRVVYHDPCYLGKQNKVYDEPRKVLENIPGLELLEFDRSKERSLCCEGGGGRMWIDITGPRLAEVRIEEAVELGAEVLATACPFCLLTFDDAVKTSGNEEKIEVKDVAELTALTL